MDQVLVLSSLNWSMSFCPDKYQDKPIFPKATPDEQLCRAIHCWEVRRSKTVNTLLLVREKLKACLSAGLQRACIKAENIEAVAMVLLRHSFCGALKWIHQVKCFHSEDLVHGTVFFSEFCLPGEHLLILRQPVKAHPCPAVETACICLNKFSSGKSSNW